MQTLARLERQPFGQLGIAISPYARF
jgi:hypothetical protein